MLQKFIHVTKKIKGASSDKDCEVLTVDRPAAPQYEWTHYRYHLAYEDWQREACELLEIEFIRLFHWQDGGPDVVLTRPDLCALTSIGADGNCLFRALCYIISGSEDQHLEI